MIRPNSEYINIKVPQEYIGKELEVFVFSSNEIMKEQKENETKRLLKKFRKITKIL